MAAITVLSLHAARILIRGRSLGDSKQGRKGEGVGVKGQRSMGHCCLFEGVIRCCDIHESVSVLVPFHYV